ncbi:MAG: aminoacyl-tRNA hydrolase [Candidatus Sungbacteria bacterium]|nr:aminoacyl-tRNA hydrolase [Candidatus Sungbacteria bacterium]
MYLIIGLGNPGEKYDNTRHNIGRAIVEAFAKKVGASFSPNKKWNALAAESKLGKEKFILLMPETFMNKSGNAVGPAARFYKIKPASVIVIHDDSDIELGRGKLSFNKSSAGHKGVESIIRALKTQSFWRFRIGIQKKRRVEAEKLVLQKFAPAEIKTAAKVIKKTLLALETLVAKGTETAMNAYNAQ